MSRKTSTPRRSIAAGSKVEGPMTRRRAPKRDKRRILERATRECRISPQIATIKSFDPALVAPDRQRIEKRLGRMFMRAVAGIDDRAIDLLRQKMHGARLGMAHDDNVGPHGVQRHRRVDESLALLHARRLQPTCS